MWEMAATSLHNDVLLDSETVTSDRPSALMLMMIRWWAALRAPEVAKWQHKQQTEWDATYGRNGGAERTVRETLLEMERFNYHAGAKGQGAAALVLDLAKAFERVGLPVVWARVTHFNFPGRNCGCYACTSSTSGEFSLKDVWRGRCRPPRPFCLDPGGVACSHVLCCRTH